MLPRVQRFADLGARVFAHVTGTGTAGGDRTASLRQSTWDSAHSLEMKKLVTDALPVTEQLHTTERSRAQMEQRLREVAEHYDEAHSKHSNAGRAGCAVLCCGPEALVSGAQRAAATVSRAQSIRFDLHTEVFEF